MIYGILIGLIIIVPILIAYYYDFKSDPKEFIFSVKTLLKKSLTGLLYLGILIGLNAVYELIIPLNKNHGFEFNTERKKLGLPIIGDNWENREYDSDQFTTIWWKSNSTDGHFKKVIEYGVLNAKFETDYYKNEKRKGTFAWSKYDFDNHTTEYFIERNNDNRISVTESGRLKFEEPMKIEKVNKSEFEKYIFE